MINDSAQYPFIGDIGSISWNKRGSVHLFEKFEKYFVIDQGSGVVTELDSITWELVHLFDEGKNVYEVQELLSSKFTRKELETAINELIELYNEGQLFSHDPCINPDPGSSRISSICLMLTNNCNLRCEYCYVFQNNLKISNCNMSIEIAKKAVDLLIEQAHPKNNLSISFFGGEPLLNIPVLKSTIGYAQQKARIENNSFKFNITTNGILLNKSIRDFLSRYPEISIIFSLDGGSKIQNQFRKLNNGKGSYGLVSKNLLELINDSRIIKNRYSVRGTFMLHNCQLVNAVKDILSLGIKELSVEPAISNVHKQLINEENVNKIKSEYDKLALFYLDCMKKKRLFSFFHFQIAMQHISLIQPIYKPCGAGNGYIAIDVNGDIYPCHRFIGNSDYKMGDVDSGIIDSNLRTQFAELNVNTKPQCTDCWAKYHCGGGCHCHGATFYEDLSKPLPLECELMRYRIEVGAYLYAVLTESDKYTLHASSWFERRPEFDVN